MYPLGYLLVEASRLERSFITVPDVELKTYFFRLPLFLLLSLYDR